MYRILVLVALIGVLTAPPLVRATATQPIASLDLRLGDLPAGFVLAKDSVMTLDQIAVQDGVSRAEEVRAGTLGGHMMAFRRDVTAGLSTVVSQIVVYASEAQVRARFARLKGAALPKGYSYATIRGLGTEAGVTVSPVSSSHGTLTLHLFVFRRGVYLVVVGLFGDKTAPTFAQSLVYPKIIDARIQHAH